eukprot:1006075-Rhodomonas_salina.1
MPSYWLAGALFLNATSPLAIAPELAGMLDPAFPTARAWLGACKLTFSGAVARGAGVEPGPSAGA